MSLEERSGPPQAAPTPSTCRESTHHPFFVSTSRRITTGRRFCRAFDEWAIRYYGEDEAAKYGIRSWTRTAQPYSGNGTECDYAERDRIGAAA